MVRGQSGADVCDGAQSAPFGVAFDELASISSLRGNKMLVRGFRRADRQERPAREMTPYQTGGRT